ncbi:MAG: hypothetical protein AAGD15_08415 [Agrobacterium cavarae]|uniref:hypothetical protein n=1 Tax=Agrobacterium cavarae TaxID=2528239 RepID=UPI0031AE9A58
MIPVVYSGTCVEIVNDYDALDAHAQDHKYWSDEKVSPVRKQIKDHYIAQQKRLCCYCRKEYPTNHNGVWDGEHVISKALAPKFMFEPRNLSASCKDCNGVKLDKEVRVNPALKKFPDESAHYTIVHPHFDEYGHHLKWLDDVVIPVTGKGIALIAMCNLIRFGNAAIGADTTPSTPEYERQVGKLVKLNSTEDEYDMALASIETHLKKVVGSSSES